MGDAVCARDGGGGGVLGAAALGADYGIVSLSLEAKYKPFHSHSYLPSA